MQAGNLESVIAASTTDAANVTTLPADAAFVAIGHIPNTEMFKGQASPSPATSPALIQPPWASRAPPFSSASHACRSDRRPLRRPLSSR